MIYRLPLLMYLTVYGFTFCIAAFLLLAGWWPFEFYLGKYTGITPFWLSDSQVLCDLLLGFAVPLLFGLGFEMAVRRDASTSVPARTVRPVSAREVQLSIAAMLVSFIFAITTIANAGGIARLGSWFDYRAWVTSRWLLFERLGFFDFVNIYAFLPVLTAIAAVGTWRRLSEAGNRIVGALVVVAVAIPVTLVDLLLFQKKSLVASLVLVGMALLVDRLIRQREKQVASTRTLSLLAASGVGIYAAYCAMVAMPILREHARGMPQTAATAPASREIPLLGSVSSGGELVVAAAEPAPDSGTGSATAAPEAVPEEQPGTVAPSTASGVPTFESGAASPEETWAMIREIRENRGTFSPMVTSRKVSHLLAGWLPGRWIGGDPAKQSEGRELLASRSVYVLLYVALAPLTRAPVPALAYPALYPDVFPYYGLDLGQDILGQGFAPDDNRLLAVFLWPRVRGGSVMVPFQFALFSQIGLMGALVLSALVGYILARIWGVLVRSSPSPAIAAAGGVVLLFAGLITQDSIRHNLVAAYGMGWAIPVLLIWFAIERTVGRSTPLSLVASEDHRREPLHSTPSSALSSSQENPTGVRISAAGPVDSRHR